MNLSMKVDNPFKAISKASFWTVQDSRKLGLNTIAQIKLRTSKGLDADLEPFRDYSTAPIYVRLDNPRLAPKGGRVSRSKQSMYFIGGYEEYKAKSRKKRGGEVDLILSGNMMNNFILIKATKTGFTIGIQANIDYAHDVNNVREFMGLNAKDAKIINDAIEYDIQDRINKS